MPLLTIEADGDREFEAISLRERVERTGIACRQPIARPKVFDVREDRVGRWIDGGSIWRTSTARSGSRAAWRPLAPRHKAGLLAKYAAQVGQANKGAVTHAGAADWPWFDR